MSPNKVTSGPVRMPPTLYLGIAGVLHPSEAAYGRARGTSPWISGHAMFEGVPVLESALSDWPTARIVLTGAPAGEHGLGLLLRHLGHSLTARVVGSTYEDLTCKIPRAAHVAYDNSSSACYSSDDYRRMNQSDIVSIHVGWSRPDQWVVVDDATNWPYDQAQGNAVLTDGCVGLLSAETQDRLRKTLFANFVR